MALEMFCGPALLYLGFSLIQIIIDLYKGLYNTSFIKFLVMILFTVFLNILCASGLTLVSWLIVFIPFISMTIITTLLLFVFGMDPASGNYNYNVTNYNSSFNYNNTGTWKIIYADGTTDFITVNNGYYNLNNQDYQLLNSNPITIKWPDGTVQTLDVVNNDGMVRWTTTSSLNKYSYIIWVPVSNTLLQNANPCPPNMTANEYNMYYGGYCNTNTDLTNFGYTSSGYFRATYYDGTYDTINLNNGSYTLNGETYTILNTNPLTIQWSDGTIQTLSTIDNDGFIKWTTNNSNNKYYYIIWEPINNSGVQQLPSNQPLPSNQSNNTEYSSCVPSCINSCTNTSQTNNPSVDIDDINSYCSTNCQTYCAQAFPSNTPSTSSLLPSMNNT